MLVVDFKLLSEWQCGETETNQKSKPQSALSPRGWPIARYS